MQKVLTAEQMRTVDRLTTERFNIPSLLLMENAAHALAHAISERLGGSVRGRNVLILCGKGNNGGDAAALARLLRMQGAAADVCLFGKVEQTAGDARVNFQAAECLSGTSFSFSEVSTIEDFRQGRDLFRQEHGRFDAVVDGLFGFGLDRPIAGFFARLADEINTMFRGDRVPLRVAIDLPSGAMADSASVEGPVVKADLTVTCTAPKLANVAIPLAAYGGELIVADIGSPKELIDEQASKTFVSETADAAEWLERASFSDDSFKNKRGHTLVIAGSREYSGAAVLAANASMRSGAGLVTLAVPKGCQRLAAPRLLPEVILRGVAETDGGTIAEAAFDELVKVLATADSVLIGCGLAKDESTAAFIRKAVEHRKQPLVLDADGLNQIAPIEFKNSPEAPALILTPHEGEFLRLLGTSDKAAVADRISAVRDMAVKRGVIVVLKGERVLIGSPDGRVVINPTGNSGVGKAGNGDTLSGIIAGITAQGARFGMEPFETVVSAVFIAGMAADVAEEWYGKRVMTASDVRECLTASFDRLERNR